MNSYISQHILACLVCLGSVFETLFIIYFSILGIILVTRESNGKFAQYGENAKNKVLAVRNEGIGSNLILLFCFVLFQHIQQQ